MGMMLPPSPQPISSTRQLAGGVGERPYTQPKAASRLGWVRRGGLVSQQEDGHRVAAGGGLVDTLEIIQRG